MGTEKLVLRFDHQENGDTVRIAVDSGWAGSEERFSTHAGLISWIRGLHPIKCEHSVPKKQSSTESWTARHEESSQSYEDMGRTINIDVETDSTAAIGMCSRTGVGKTRHIQVRWLWIQDAIRDKVARLRKVKGTDNEAEMGNKDLDGSTHQLFLQKLPLKPTECRRLLDLIATANGGSVVEVRMSGSEEAFRTNDDCDIDSIGDVGPDGCTTSEETARSNSSGKDC